MYYTESIIEIKADADEVYEAIKNVSRWPEIFPPCQAAKILKTEKNRIEVEMTAITKNKEFSWKSERIYDDEKRIVAFKQYEPAKSLKSMKGEWLVETKDSKTIVRLTHTYEVNSKIFKGFVSYIAKVFFIDSNSERELKGLKLYLEGK